MHKTFTSFYRKLFFAFSLYCFSLSFVLSQGLIEDPQAVQVSDVSAAVYVSAWRVEKEFLLRPLALQEWLPLGLSESSTLTLDQRNEIATKASAFLKSKWPLSIDFQQAKFEIDAVRFIEPRADQFVPIKDNATVSVNNVMISVLMSAPLPKLDTKLSMQWDLYSDRFKEIPIRVADMIGTTLFTTTQETPVIEVKPRLASNARDVPKAPVAPPVPEKRRPLSSIVLLVLGICFFSSVFFKKENAKKLIVLGAASVIMGVLSMFLLNKNIYAHTSLPVTAKQSEDITDRLIEGVYHAFNFTDENTQYDVVGQVAGKEALKNIYLEVHRTMETREADGTRVRVLNVVVEDAKPEALSGAFGFSTTCHWKAFGEIGHWGHFHRRINKYAAKLNVEPVDGAWKLTSLSGVERQREVSEVIPKSE